MFVLVLANGSARHLPGVAKIKHENGVMLCLDEEGGIVDRYKPQEVMVYGDESSIDALMSDFSAAPTIVEKRVAANGLDCAARGCELPATLILDFDSALGRLTVGLCEAHQPLIDQGAKRIALDRLDLRRLAISDVFKLPSEQ